MSGAKIMKNWVSSAIDGGIFWDYRHGRRLQSLLKRLSQRLDKSVPQALETDSQTQAAYRFWSNIDVKASQIIASQQTAGSRRIVASGAVVLAVQDTAARDQSA
jgi:hypothetical protein